MLSSIATYKSPTLSSLLTDEIFKRSQGLKHTPPQDDFFYSSARILIEYILNLVHYLSIKNDDKNLAMVLCLTNTQVLTGLLLAQAKLGFPSPCQLLSTLLESNSHAKNATITVAYDVITQYLIFVSEQDINLILAQVVSYQSKVHALIELL